MIFRIFGVSFAVSVAALVVAFLYGGPQALLLCAILGILEVSLSFDNAVINATVLQRMSEFWQKIFLTVGVLIAVFGMRLVFPLAIVWLASGLGPVEALDLALNPPADGGAYFPDGSPQLRNADHRRAPADRGVRRHVPADALPRIHPRGEGDHLAELDRTTPPRPCRQARPARGRRRDHPAHRHRGVHRPPRGQDIDGHDRRRARHDHLHRRQRPRRTVQRRGRIRRLAAHRADRTREGHR